MHPTTPHGWAWLALRRYAQFRGRAPRTEYWWFFAFNVAASVAAEAIDYLSGLRADDPGSFGGPVSNLLALVLLLPSLAVTVRRLHDTGRTGWWIGGAVPVAMLWFIFMMALAFMGFKSLAPIAMAGVIAMLCYIPLILYFATRPGTPGSNRFGPAPDGLEGEAEQLAQDFACPYSCGATIAAAASASTSLIGLSLSHLAMTAVATALPMTLVALRPMSRKWSTARISSRPASGMLK